MKPYYPSVKYDVFADWEINFFCNFNCPYCFYHHYRKQRDPRYAGHNIEKLTKAFDDISGTWLIHMSGGEPLFQPNLVELCRRLTRRHYVSINSNLSTPTVYDLAERLDARRVPRILASLHVGQRRDLEEFVNRIKYLEDRDFKVYVSQVMYPPILNHFEKTFQYFRKKGVVTKPKVFHGFYMMKRYPQSYTAEERSLLMRYYDEGRYETNDEEDLDGTLSMEKSALDGELSLKGIKCHAGKSYVFVRYNGDVLRCPGNSTRLGNIFEGNIDLLQEPERCRSQVCSCPLYGLRYAEGIPSVMGFNFGTLRSMLYKTYLWADDGIRGIFT